MSTPTDSRWETQRPSGVPVSQKKKVDQMKKMVNLTELSKINDAIELLDSAQNVMSLDLPKDGFPPPQMPGITSFTSESCLTNTVPEATGDDGEDKRMLGSDLLREYRDISIMVKKWYSFDSSDIDLNELWEVDWAPDFVTEF